jgi:hypothetical protein
MGRDSRTLDYLVAQLERVLDRPGEPGLEAERLLDRAGELSERIFERVQRQRALLRRLGFSDCPG